MYPIRISHLIILCMMTLLLLVACASESTALQGADATIQAPETLPSATPVPPTPLPSATPIPPTPTSTPGPPESQESFHNVLPYDLDGMEQVEVRSIEYRRVDGQPYLMDVYYPPQLAPDERLPVVIFVMGISDKGAQQLFGARLKDLDPYKSWGRLVAAAGMIGVTYETERPDDLDHVVQTVRQNAGTLQIDANQIGLWSSSANSLSATSFAMQDEHNYLNFAVFYYGLMLTPDNFRLAELQGICQDVGCYVPHPEDDAAGLANVEQIRTDLPLLIARAGKDDLVNPFIDHFVEQATVADAKLMQLDHPEGEHSFDHMQSDERTSEIIAQTLEFMSANFAQP